MIWSDEMSACRSAGGGRGGERGETGDGDQKRDSKRRWRQVPSATHLAVVQRERRQRHGVLVFLVLGELVHC